MRVFLALTLVMLTAPPLTAGPSPSPAPASPTPNPILASLARLNGQEFDVAFMRTLIPVHEEAIEIALAATLNADHSELLQWNQRMIDRKSAQVRQMLAWLKEAGASPGRRNAGVVTDAVKKMRALRSAALERAYLPLMAAHLDQSLALGRLAAAKASRPDLRTLAQELVKAESQEVTMLRGWLAKWYPR